MRSNLSLVLLLPRHLTSRQDLASEARFPPNQLPLPLDFTPQQQTFHLLYCSATHTHTRHCFPSHPPGTAETMFGLRSIRTASPVLRSSLARSPRQVGARRWASGEAGELKGAADNAFNRERQAVKDHAAATAGITSYPSNIFHPDLAELYSGPIKSGARRMSG